MKKVIVYGNTILSKMLYYDALCHDGFEIACFTVDSCYLSSNEFLDKPQVDFDIVETLYPPESFDMISVVGGYSNMRFREQMYKTAKQKGYALVNYISPKADITPEITLGENNIIFPNSHIGIGGIMGNNNIIRQNVYLGHDFRIGNNNFIGAGSNIGGNCKLFDTIYIGLGATIINNITVAEESLIGAGSVVIKNTEPYSKNVGNPSRVIGYHKEEGIKMSVSNG